MKPTIFTYLDNILYKKGNKVFKNVDTENTYNHFMMCRWLSMHSPAVAQLVNETANWLYPIMEDKQLSYKFLNNIIPRQQFRRFHYVKKVKKDNNDSNKEMISILAKELELSEREVTNYVDQLHIDLDKYNLKDI